jgi:hypothetical protein
MKTKHIIIIIAIIIGLYVILKNKREGLDSSPTLSNEAIQSISSVYSNTAGTVAFNKVRATKGFIGDLSGNVRGDLSGNIIGNVIVVNASGNKLKYEGDDLIAYKGDTALDSITVKKICLKDTTDGKTVCLSANSGAFGSLNITKKDGKTFSLSTDGNNQGLGKIDLDGQVAWVNSWA